MAEPERGEPMPEARGEGVPPLRPEGILPSALPTAEESAGGTPAIRKGKMPSPRPMPVKHWSFAGLLLTDWCNARCASCYLACGPDGREEMTAATALRFWRELAEASPTGCRIHLSGGEPSGDWHRLIEICRRAHAEGLSSPGGRGPLQKIETNAFWATDEGVIRTRLIELDRAGLGKLAISADPYHQQFVPIERCRLLVRVAERVLGADRVQVRWRDWLANGFDTDRLGDIKRAALFANWAASGRDRFNGRAAVMLAMGTGSRSASFAEGVPVAAVAAPSGGDTHGVNGPPGQRPSLASNGGDRHGANDAPSQSPSGGRKKLGDSADNGCRDSLLRSRHVHIDAAGRITPGTCAGIILGNASDGIATVWQRLNDEGDRRPVLGALCRGGPAALAELAGGPKPAIDGYRSRCHMCWDVRRRLVERGLFADELGPARLYDVRND